MALATADSMSVNAPTFASTTVANLSVSIISVNLAWLVELRCMSNMLYTPSVGDLNVMRADELATITSPNGAI